MSENVEAPGYFISFSKQTSQLGEVIQINTNMAKGATQEQIGDELKKLAGALDARMKFKNEEVVAETGKTLKELGVTVPGFNDDPEG